MKFLPVWPASGTADAALLRPELREGRRLGVLTLGESHLFIRKLRACWYLPYAAVARYFRRVQAVPVRLGCCGGEVRVENLVLCVRQDGAELERAVVQLPGERAALAVLEEMKRRAPDALCGCPPKGEAAP